MCSITDKAKVVFDKQQEQLAGSLHLTSIEGVFDPKYDIALGPHCFLGNDDVFPEWRKLSFAEPFPNEASLVSAEENLRGLVNYLLPEIVERLNAYHGTSHSIDFWRLIIFPWLIELAQKSWTSFVRLRLLIGLHGARLITVKVDQNDTKWSFTNTRHFFDVMLEDGQFSWWIDSQVIEALAPSNWHLQPSRLVSHTKKPVVKKPRLQPKTGAIRKFVKNLQYQLGYSQILGIRWSGLLLSLYVNLLPKSPSSLHFSPNPEFCPQPYFPASYLICLKKLIDITIPKSCLDGFEILAARACQFRYVPGRLRLGDPIYWNDQEKVMAAFAKEAGEKRVVCQHGGEYGMVRYNMMANEIDLQSTVFISWGWSHDTPTGCHVLPLPSPFHSKIKDKHKLRNNTLIVIGQTVRINLHRIHWTFRINFAREYCNHTVDFLQNLSKRAIRSVVFRPYAHTINNIEVGDIVAKKFPDIPFLEKDLNDALIKCRLVVHPSYGTTMNLTMAANTPTVVYMPPSMMVPRKEAMHCFKLLKRCGIAHDSPGDAARHINHIWGDVEGWWSSSEVQKARKVWVSQYARADRFWWWQWVKALAQLKNTG